MGRGLGLLCGGPLRGQGCARPRVGAAVGTRPQPGLATLCVHRLLPPGTCLCCGGVGLQVPTLTQGPSPALLSPQIYEVVRPLVSLLHLQRTGLENFEGLMALTNLAGISERLR